MSTIWLDRAIKGSFMSALSQVEKIPEKHAVSAEEFIRSGAIMNLAEKQRRRCAGTSCMGRFN